MRYIPHTPQDIAEMLQVIGVESVADLFKQIPVEGQLNRPLAIPEPMCEPDLIGHMSALAEKNKIPTKIPPFLGGGVYPHVSPTAVDHLLHRGEFFTAYTPYQAELSQGTLQVIFEFQTMVAEVLGTEVANASLYDGSTGMSEGILMARRITRRQRALVSEAVHPEYREVAATYNEGLIGALDIIPLTAGGLTDMDALRAAMGDDVACVVIQTPNFFGCLEEVEEAAQIAHDAGALLVAVNNEPTAFGLLQPPGKMGADIVAGEGQALGLPVNLGGPHCGLLGTRKKYIRQIPGRLCGRSKDSTGAEGFVLTLSTREQHIRREKATSNICTNQGLMALAVCIYLTLMGPEGLKQVARTNLALAHHLKKRVEGSKKLTLAFPETPVYNEMVILLEEDALEASERLCAMGIVPGLPLSRVLPGWSNGLLVNVTERHSIAHVDALVDALEA